MPDKSDKPKQRRGHYYWWTLANTLMACVAIVSWVMCLHVFGHPEIPRNYEWLKQLGRVAEPVGFELQLAPPGEAADPEALYNRYAPREEGGMDRSDLARLNAALLRNYLSELEEPGLIQYIEGDFRILEVRALGEGDLFTDGFAVRAQAMVQQADEFTQASPWPVIVEYLFPTASEGAIEWFVPGDELKVAKVPNCAIVLHVARETGEDTPVVAITCVPIVMGEYQVGQDRSFTLRKPLALDPAAPLPVFGEGRGAVE